VKHYAGQEAALVAETTANPRYHWERNKGVPRKIGSKLWLYDCINCDKCVSGLSNDANFVYEAPAAAMPPFRTTISSCCRKASGAYRAAYSSWPRGASSPTMPTRATIAATAMSSAPKTAVPTWKSRASSAASRPTKKYAGANGFYIDFTPPVTIYGTIAGEAYILMLDPAADCAPFETQTR